MKTIAIMLICASACWAQDSPRFSKSLTVLIAAQLAASGADAYYTNRNFQYRYGATEFNPIARLFMGSTSSRVAYFSLDAAAHVGVALILRKHHHRLAEAVLAEGVADNTYGAATSAAHYNPKLPAAYR